MGGDKIDGKKGGLINMGEIEEKLVDKMVEVYRKEVESAVKE